MTDFSASDASKLAPEPITANLILEHAQYLFRQSLHRTGHVWVIALSFELVQKFGPRIGPRPLSAVFAIAAPLVGAWISAAGVRGLLQDRRPLWAVDQDFFRYLGASLLLALPIAAIGLLADRVGAPASMLLYISMIALLVFMLRYLLWPIGLLVGDRGTSAPESVRLMNGRIASFVGACLQFAIWIVLPFVVILVGTLILPASTRTLTHPLLLALVAIAATLMTMGSTSLWSAMYLLAVRLADSSHNTQGS